MSTQKRNTYSKEFKSNAVRMVLEEKRRPSEVARDLGIHENLIYTWIHKHQNTQHDITDNKSNTKDAEIRRLERELKRVTDERDILKKAAIFFAKDQ